MWIWILSLFKGKDWKTTAIVAASAVLALLLFGSVAYASYSFAKRGEQERIEDVKKAMTEQFDKERQTLISTLQRSDSIDRSLNDMRAVMERQQGEISGKLEGIRKQYRDIYEIILPKEGIDQWEASRNVYNSSARPSAASR